MSDIPLDIMQDVFKHFSSPLRLGAATRNFPWHLGHVCSQWRAVFFSMRSTFWNRIKFDWYDVTRLGQAQEIVAFFLDRTCGAPLSLEMRLLRQCYPYVRPILVDLIVHSEQWEELDISLEPSELRFLCGIKGRLPLLRKLRITVMKDTNRRSTDRAIVPSTVVNVFGDAPLLTNAMLWNVPLWQFKFNWSSLTVVNFQESLDSPKNILHTLREIINLVELTIDHEFPDGLDSEGHRLIHLPRLEDLSITDEAFLTILETPSLQQLRISYHYSQCLDSAGIITVFLRRSGIKLSTLIIEQGLAETVKEILRFTPELDKLALYEVLDMADVFKWLAGTGTLRCSNLTVLWADPMYGEHNKDLEALHDMITRRNHLDHVREPSPRKLIIGCYKDESRTANLELMCRKKGIRFEFADFLLTWPWGINTIRELWYE